MTISQKHIDKFKKLYREKENREISDSEATEAAYNFYQLVELLYEISMREEKRKARLRKEPKGFLVDGQYSCVVCGNTIEEGSGWYDWHGNKCNLCQKALDEGVIPSFVCHNRDSFFRTWKLKSDLNLHHQTIKKMVKEGKLVAREILNSQGGVHEYIFLKKENPILIEKFNPVGKSYDRHREKEHRKWVKEQIMKYEKEKA